MTQLYYPTDEYQRPLMAPNQQAHLPYFNQRRTHSHSPKRRVLTMFRNRTTHRVCLRSRSDKKIKQVIQTMSSCQVGWSHDFSMVKLEISRSRIYGGQSDTSTGNFQALRFSNFGNIIALC